jgi:hypothetical protein
MGVKHHLNPGEWQDTVPRHWLPFRPAPPSFRVFALLCAENGKATRQTSSQRCAEPVFLIFPVKEVGAAVPKRRDKRFETGPGSTWQVREMPVFRQLDQIPQKLASGSAAVLRENALH